MKVLLAYDGSTFADVALADLRWAGLPAGSEVVVLTVADVWGPPAPDATYDEGTTAQDLEIRERANVLRRKVDEALAEAQQSADAAAERLRSDLRDAGVDVDVRAEVCQGTPAWELIKRASAWPADLVVVGTEGHGALGRLLLGSVSQKVLNEARCSVRIARPHAGAAGTAARVLVADDGSAPAAAAVNEVARRAWPAGSVVRLVLVDDPFNRPAGSQTSEGLAEVLAASAARLRAAGLTVDPVTGWGDARHVILDEAATWRADCIVMGAQGEGRLEHLLLGSVSSAVANGAKCSVEVVRGSP